MKILLTGAAGFIGSHVAKKLSEHYVVGIDNINDYYDVKLKLHRLESFNQDNFEFHKINIVDYESLDCLFLKHKFDAVVNLAARAGVTYSVNNPKIYYTTNVMGTFNLLDLMKKHGVGKFVLASTSSLYAGHEMPFNENLKVNPITPYASSKKAAEDLAHVYHFLHGIDVSIVRYFTVYGPSGRPDMSIFRFIKWISEDKPIRLNGTGNQSRDFTYIDDIADGTVKALKNVGCEVINLGGGNSPTCLLEIINIIQTRLQKPARLVLEPELKADFKESWADIGKAKELLNWKPTTGIKEGLEKTIEWHEKNFAFLKNVQV